MRVYREIRILAALALLIVGCEASPSVQNRDGSGVLAVSGGDGVDFRANSVGFTLLPLEIHVEADVIDALGERRSVTLRVPAELGAIGSFSVEVVASIEQSQGWPELEVPVTGTLTVRESARDCSGNGSGVSFCFDTLDASLVASGAASGVRVETDLTLLASPALARRFE